MTEAKTIDRSKLFHQAYLVMLLLSIVSVGTSGLISTITLKSLEQLEPIALVLIPIYVVSAILIKRESMDAYYAAFLAFTLSSIQTLILSLMNARLAVETIGLPLYIGLTALNISFVIVVWAILFRGYNLLRRTS
ncbi:MAG: hypothetical protein AAF633_16700 [Chloroflexota bacterium]